jgi:hypothetical protein
MGGSITSREIIWNAGWTARIAWGIRLGHG